MKIVQKQVNLKKKQKTDVYSCKQDHEKFMKLMKTMN